MLLVREGVAKVITLSMLIVGHTHIKLDQRFSIPSIHMTKMARTTPMLATPEKMIDSWKQAYQGHPDSPSIEFVHAVRDIKGYFDTAGSLDKIFGGHAGYKKARKKKVPASVLVSACLPVCLPAGLPA